MIFWRSVVDLELVCLVIVYCLSGHVIIVRARSRRKLSCDEDPPNVKNGFLTLAGDSVIYTCPRWYRFADGNKTKTIQCTEDGWPPIDDCMPGRCADGWVRYEKKCYGFDKARALNFTEALNVCNSTDIKSLRLNHLAVSPKDSALEQRGPVEYFKKMIRSYIKHKRGPSQTVSGQFWVGLYRDPRSKDWLWADSERQAVPFIPPERPDARYAYVNVSVDKDDVNVTLGFDTEEKEYNYICEEHARCPGVDDSDDTLYQQRSNQLTTNDRVCPEISQVTCYDGLWRMSSCLKRTVIPEEEIERIIPCLPLPSTDTEQALSNSTRVGALVVVRCTAGYEFPDRSTEREYACSTKGQWVPHIASCAKIHRCPALNISDDINCTMTEEANPGVLSDCHCPPGYMFIDFSAEKRFFCQEDATWSDILPVCVESGRYCSHPPYVHNADLLSNETVFYVNSTITFRCIEGHRFRDEYRSKELTTRCSTEGRWDLHYDDCHLVHCPSIPYVLMKKMELAAEIANSSVPTFIPDKIDPIYSAEVNISCLEENQAFPDGTTTRIIQCSEEGEWQPAVPLCMLVESGPMKRVKRYVPPAMEAPGSETIGTVAIVFISVFFAGIVVLDLNSIARACVMLYHNLSGCRLAEGSEVSDCEEEEEEKEKMNTTRDEDVVFDVIENGQTVTEKCFDDSSLCYVDEVSDDRNSGIEDGGSDIYEKAAMKELDRQSIGTQTDEDSVTQDIHQNHDVIL